MGTRNLTMVIQNGQTKVAQYGQWDGYPEGQGATALKFLKSSNLQHFTNQLQKCQFLKDSGGYPPSNFVDRDHGAEILNEINNTNESEIKLIDSTNFAGDSVFCEWGYVVDFDTQTFEVYKGFNKIPLVENDRFFFLQTDGGNHGHYPIKILEKFSLTDLPTLSKFLEICEGKLTGIR
jgi:hypothetical protein